MANLVQELRCDSFDLCLAAPRPLLANEVFESIYGSRTFVMARDVERQTPVVIMPRLQDAAFCFHFASTKLQFPGLIREVPGQR